MPAKLLNLRCDRKVSAQNNIRIENGRCYKISVCSVIESIGAFKDIVGGESFEISDKFTVLNGGKLQPLSAANGTRTDLRIEHGLSPTGSSPPMQHRMSPRNGRSPRMEQIMIADVTKRKGAPPPAPL